MVKLFDKKMLQKKLVHPEAPGLAMNKVAEIWGRKFCVALPQDFVLLLTLFLDAAHKACQEFRDQL